MHHNSKKQVYWNYSWGMGDSNSHRTQKPSLAWVKTQNLPLELPVSLVSSSCGRSLLSSRSCCLFDLGARSCDSGDSHDFLLPGCQLGENGSTTSLGACQTRIVTASCHVHEKDILGSQGDYV